MKKEVKFEKKHIEWLYVLLVIGALAVGGAAIFVLPQQSYSEAENRYLINLSPPESCLLFGRLCFAETDENSKNRHAVNICLIFKRRRCLPPLLFNRHSNATQN